MNSSKHEKQVEDIHSHQLAMGKIVMAWNEYQEKLGEIFAQLFGRRNWGLALAAWQALENERAQRAMLTAVARQKLKPANPLLGEIIWLVKTTDQILSDQRNIGVHMPIMKLTDLNVSFIFFHHRCLETVELLAWLVKTYSGNLPTTRSKSVK